MKKLILLSLIAVVLLAMIPQVKASFPGVKAKEGFITMTAEGDGPLYELIPTSSFKLLKQTKSAIVLENKETSPDMSCIYDFMYFSWKKFTNFIFEYNFGYDYAPDGYTNEEGDFVKNYLSELDNGIYFVYRYDDFIDVFQYVPAE
jgi:hypothetical protein